MCGALQASVEAGAEAGATEKAGVASDPDAGGDFFRV
jgi:hypothetical protein